MGSKANPTVIGAFVVGAVVLVVAALLIFSGGKVFTEKIPFVMYFDSSVNGLNIGAPVKFKGVQVGEVSDIIALFDTRDLSVLVEVRIAVTPSHFTDKETRLALGAAGDRQDRIGGLIQKGMRASLQLQSMVTGLLFIEIDFRPDVPAKLLGLNKNYIELPTAPSAMGQLMANVKQAVNRLGELPIDQVLTELIAILQRLKDILNSPNMDGALADIGLILKEAQTGLQQIFQQVPTLVDRLAAVEDESVTTLRAARTLLKDAQTLVRHVNAQVEPLSSHAQETLTAARGALQQGEKTLKDVDSAVQPALGQAERALGSVADLTGPDSIVLNDLSQALRALEEAARSVRVLADSLERNPESLIRGKSR